jgi:predicted nucleotidyltransferase
MGIKEDILKMLVEEPQKEFYIRELSRMLKKSPTTISKYVKELEKDKLLVSYSKLGHLIFKASGNEKFRNKKISYNINLIEESGLIEFLKEEYSPEAIILFGSFAKGENSKNSDIDLLVVSPYKKEANLNKFRPKLGQEIQLFIHSKKELDSMKKSNKELLNNLINGIKLYGFFEVFK